MDNMNAENYNTEFDDMVLRDLEVEEDIVKCDENVEPYKSSSNYHVQRRLER